MKWFKEKHLNKRLNDEPIAESQGSDEEPAADQSILANSGYEALNGLNQISKLLGNFDDLETSFPTILRLAARVINMKSALVIDDRAGEARAIVWRSPGVNEEMMSVAKTNAEKEYAHVTGLSVECAGKFRVRSGQGQLAKSAQGLEAQKEKSEGNYIAIPLVVNHHPVFGILQIECVEQVNDVSLAFVNALANQLASAIDHQFQIRHQCELRAQEEASCDEASLLQRKRGEALEAQTAKSRFLANISHEIRTPLGAIMGFSDLLVNDDVHPADRAKFAATIRRNGELLTKLIDDVLELSKIEVGEIKLGNRQFNLRELVAEVKTGLDEVAEGKGVNFDVVYEDSVPDVLYADRKRLKQILVNLIGNAIKFTDFGSVSVKVSLISMANRAKIKFTIDDTGKGITLKEAQQLFQPFTQADSASTRQYGGTGLGLALSRRLAIAMGGNVELVASVPGKGSKFAVTLEQGDIGQQRRSGPEIALVTQLNPSGNKELTDRKDRKPGFRTVL